MEKAVTPETENGGQLLTGMPLLRDGSAHVQAEAFTRSASF